MLERALATATALVVKVGTNALTTPSGVFDAGRLSDGLGRTADFRRVVVALTTNIGARVPRVFIG